MSSKMKILKIEEIDNIKSEDVKNLVNPPKDSRIWFSNMDGYKITTDVKDIYILIDNMQCCCEDWGQITSEEDFDNFVGSEITDYRFIDNADYNEINILKKAAGEYVDIFDCAFVDFNTTKGNLQFAVYNHHNGYYGHDIKYIEIDK